MKISEQSTRCIHITESESNVNLYVTIVSDSTNRWEVLASEDGKVDFILNVEGAIRMIDLLQHVLELHKKRELINENQ
jgi:hypothetical protein